jgi:RNA polymerase sigma factor (sigma-70 family)
MKELEVTLTVRNNRLKQRREQLGLSQAMLAELAGINLNLYSGLERIRVSPICKKTGTWRAGVSRLVDYLEVSAEELFPEAVQRLEQSQAVKKLDATDIPALLSGHQERLLLSGPDDQLVERELLEATEQALGSLSDRERSILRMRFVDGMSLREIGNEEGVGSERIRQIEAEALRKLRHPNRSRLLKPFVKEYGGSGFVIGDKVGRWVSGQVIDHEQDSQGNRWGWVSWEDDTLTKVPCDSVYWCSCANRSPSSNTGKVVKKFFNEETHVWNYWVDWGNEQTKETEDTIGKVSS